MKTQHSNIFTITFIVLFAALIGTLCILNIVPPISRDALTHHLAVPKLYLQHGSIYEIPELPFSYYPMNLDLLYLAALSLGNEILPKYIHMVFGLATALLIFFYLKKRLSNLHATLGALLFLSTPIIIKLSITVYVDLGLIFFSTASLLLVLSWVEKKEKFHLLIFAGISCGLGIGTKYNGMLVFFLLTLFIPVLIIRSSHEQANRSSTVFGACLVFFLFALLTVSPWLVRNYIWTGNPVYPLYDFFFNPPETIQETIDGSDGIKGVLATRYVLYGESIWQLLLLPVRIFFQGVDDSPRYFDGRLNPFLLLFPLLAFTRQPEQEAHTQLEKKTFLAFCILYFLFAFNTSVLRIRYLAPMIPFLVILAMYGLSNLESTLKRHVTKQTITTIVCGIPITLMLMLNGRYLQQQFILLNPIGYITTSISRDDYIARFRPEYPVMQYANTNLPQSAKILCLFIGDRGYYLDRTHLFDHHSKQKLLLSWLKDTIMSDTEILERLQRNKISHILVRRDLFSDWAERSLPEDRRRLIVNLVKNNFIHLKSFQDYSLYGLVYTNIEGNE